MGWHAVSQCSRPRNRRAPFGRRSEGRALQGGRHSGGQLHGRFLLHLPELPRGAGAVLRARHGRHLQQRRSHPRRPCLRWLLQPFRRDGKLRAAPDRRRAAAVRRHHYLVAAAPLGRGARQAGRRRRPGGLATGRQARPGARRACHTVHHVRIQDAGRQAPGRRRGRTVQRRASDGRARLDREVQPLRLLAHALRYRLRNLQNIRRAWQVGRQHYDLSNELYKAMLDSRLTYSCGYWENATNLEQAQEAKLELICRKLQLKPGMRLLDIGCGWGSLMAYAAQHHGVECVGVTVSQEQANWAGDRYRDLPVEFRLQDYRSLNERFDRIASVGMFEHVGHKNHRAFMQVAHRCLADNGLLLLHSIGKNARRGHPDPWIDRYIFPNGDLPSIGQIGDAADDLFVVEDLRNFGADYDRTLMAWHANFEAAWPRFSAPGERFRRMWRYYLLSCAGAFRARDIQLWQWVLSKRGVIGGYRRPQS
nr:cyclopropane fatty acyl phospholipid synthase [Pseudomonas aeruginosa]